MDFIKASRATGQTDEQIKAILKQNGWQDAALAGAFGPQVPQAPLPQPTQIYPRTPFVAPTITPTITPQQTSSSGSKVLVSVIVILLIAIAAAAGYYFLVLNKSQPDASLAQDATPAQDQLVPVAVPAAVQPDVARTNAASPKDTFLAMEKDFGSFVAGKTNLSTQDVLAIIKSVVFTQFIDTYMTADAVTAFDSMSDTGKSTFFTFGLLAAFAGPNSTIQENIVGTTATLNYNGASISLGTASAVLKCSIKMVLENGSWKWAEKPLADNNAACIAS